MASTQDDVVVRLRLKDVSRFIADVRSGKLAIEDLENKIEKTGRTAKRQSSPGGGLAGLASGFQSLTMWGMRGAGVLAIAGAGVAGFAVKSAANLEQVTMSFETLLGSASKAKTMVADLQQFAKATPFNLQDVEQGAQKMLAFGFAAKSVVPSMTAIGNAVAGLNLGPEGFDRVITALGQIKMKGRLQGDETLQLAEAGINANAYLEKAFHLTPQQLQKAQQAGKISAAAAIPVILAGMDKQFHGLMAKQSTTLGGIWSNLFDATQQGLTAAVNPFLPAMKKWLQKAVDAIPGIMTRVQGGLKVAGEFLGKLWTKVDEIRNSRSFQDFVGMLQAFGRVLSEVAAPAVMELASALGGGDGLGGALGSSSPALTDLFNYVADHADVFKGVAETVLVAAAAYKVWTAAIWLVTAAQWAWNAAADANPIGIVIVATAALAAGLVYAYNHSDTFRRSVDHLFGGLKTMAEWIKLVWPTIGPILTRPFNGLIDTFNAVIYAYNNTLGRFAGEVGGPDTSKGIGGGGGRSVDIGTKGIGHHPYNAPHQADGGITVRGGMSWVGERGPELLNLPRGAQVIPLPRVPAMAGSGGGDIHVHVDLDGREIATAVVSNLDSRSARL